MGESGKIEDTGPGDDLLTVEQAAALLRMSPEMVRVLAREGKIPAGKFGRVWRFSRRALLRHAGDSDA